MMESTKCAWQMWLVMVGLLFLHLQVMPIASTPTPPLLVNEIRPISNIVPVSLAVDRPAPNVNCGEKVNALVNRYLKQIEGVPRPAGSTDNATITTSAKIRDAIQQAAEDLAGDCQNIGASRTQFVTTEVEDLGDSLVIYQIGIQRLEFEPEK